MNIHRYVSEKTKTLPLGWVIHVGVVGRSAWGVDLEQVVDVWGSESRKNVQNLVGVGRSVISPTPMVEGVCSPR